MSYSFMPVSISMQGRKCLVVGGGNVAVRKVETLLQYDCSVTVVSPEVHGQIAAWAKEGALKLETREYAPPEAALYGLVISATADTDLNKQVHDDAQGAGVMVNVVDVPGQCEFIFPGVIRRDCLTLSISTDARAPFMSGHLRNMLNSMFPKHWDRMMKMAGIYRDKVLKAYPKDIEKKKAAYERFVQADWAKMIHEMNNADLEAELDTWIKE